MVQPARPRVRPEFALGAGALSHRAAAPPLLLERLQPRAFSRIIAASMPREGTARIASPRLSRELAGWRRKLAAEAAPARSNLSFPILEQAALAVAFAALADARQAHPHQPLPRRRRQGAPVPQLHRAPVPFLTRRRRR